MNPFIGSKSSELEVLAVAAKDPERTVFLELHTDSEDFTSVIRQKIRHLIIEMYYGKLELSQDFVADEYLKRWSEDNAVAELEAFRDAVGHSPNWDWHLRRVRGLSVRRKAMRQAQVVLELVQAPDTDDDIQPAVEQLSATVGDLGQTIIPVVGGADITAEAKQEYFSGSSGYIDLGMGPKTWPFRGMRRGEVFTIMARTWVGKSFWASQAALNSKVPTLIVSAEMPRLQWWERTLAQLLGVNIKEAMGRLATGRATQEERSLVESAERKIAIADHCEPTIPALEAALKYAKGILSERPRLLVIDYLQLFPLGSNRSSKIYERVSEAALAVKRFAKNAEVAILLLSQVGRQQGGDGATELGLESARDSGQIEEAADFLLGLWRPCQAKGLTQQERDALEPQMKGRLLKNRRGKAFEWNFLFNGSNFRITPEVL